MRFAKRGRADEDARADDETGSERFVERGNFAEHGGAGSKVAGPIAQALHAKFFKIDLQHPADR